MEQLIDTLAARLRRPPQTAASVRRLWRRDDRRWHIEVDGQPVLDADAVALTCPAPAQAAILEAADGELAGRLRQVPYNRIAVIALGYRAEEVPHPLDGFGYLCPQRERRDLLGAQWCSSIFPGRAPPGMVLLRTLCGGWHRSEMLDWDDDRLIRTAAAELGRALGIAAAPRFVHLIRWPQAIPQYHLGHLQRLAWIDERLQRHPRLYLGGNAHRGIALNDCVEQASLLAERMGRALQASH